MTTTGHGSAMRSTTASRCGASSLHQHQKLTHTERGNSWGLCAPIPAVVYDDTQDRPASSRRAGFFIDAFTTSLLTGAGFGRRPFSHSHRVAIPSLAQSRKQAVGSSRLIACAYSRCAGSSRARDLSLRVVACKRSRANTLTVKQLSQSLAHRNHHHHLSSPLFSSGIDPNENGLTHAQAFFAFGANSSD